jgi:hypothetical protein
MIAPGDLTKVPTLGEAGSFVEWAGFGGVAGWDKGNSILMPPFHVLTKNFLQKGYSWK